MRQVVDPRYRGAGLLLVLTALYVILEPIHRTLALLATFWSLVYVLMWIRMTLNLLDALRILSDAPYLRKSNDATFTVRVSKVTVSLPTR